MGDERTEPFFDKASNTGLTHFVNATRFSMQGVSQAVRREAAFRQELILLVVLTPVAVWMSQTPMDFVALMAVAGFVLVIELINSAIEATLDRVGTEYNEFTGLAKDYGSAAVMLSLLVAGMVWLAFLIQRLIS